MVKSFVIKYLQKRLRGIDYTISSLEYDVSIRRVAHREWKHLERVINNWKGIREALIIVIQYLDVSDENKQ